MKSKTAVQSSKGWTEKKKTLDLENKILMHIQTRFLGEKYWSFVYV